MSNASKNAEIDALAMRSEQMTRTVAALEQRIAMLEEENIRFAHLLREHGINVRATSQVALELPPPLEDPLATKDASHALLSGAEQRLLDEACSGSPFFLLIRSATKVDTGHWFRRAPVWVAALADRLVLLAWGAKPWFDAIPFRHLKQSLYNHVTGEVVLAPASGLRIDRFKIAPADGAQILAQIYASKEDDHA